MTMKTMNLNDCATYLKEHDGYLLVTHIRPDGDTLGSAAALCHILRRMGKTAYVYDNPETTAKYRPWTEPYLVPADFVPACVVGIDLAGDEMATPIESYAPQFEMAKQLGVNFTIHAGESGPASNVAFALSIGAKRIGHGIHSIQDERVVKEIIEKGVTLEVSPTSNVLSRCVPSYKEHPIRTFFDRGVRVNVNTDDPSLFGIRLEEEYQKLRETFHFTEKELALMNLYGAEASFCEGKEKVIEELKAYLAAAE